MGRTIIAGAANGLISTQCCEKGKVVYFGTGLATAREESLGFGFELLNLVLTALVLMDELGADGILHEIGTVGYDISEKHRNWLIENQLSFIEKMTRNLDVADIYSVKLSHSYHDSDYFKRILQHVKMKMRAFSDLANFRKYGYYTLFQISQMKYLYDIEKAAVKVGWIIGNKPVLDRLDANVVEALILKGHLNEYYFDSIYRYVFPDDEFLFVYTQAGIDVMNGKRYAPYTVTVSQNRPLMVDPIKPYLSRIPDSKHKKKVLSLYNKRIIYNWEYLFGEIETLDHMPDDDKVIDKLQHIQDRILGENAG